MDFKSPLKKRQKLNGTKFSDIEREMNQVVQLRKIQGGIIEEMCTAEAEEGLKYLSRIKVELPPPDTHKIPNLDIVLEKFKRLPLQHDEIITKNLKQITLLDTLERKRNCPIAKIIDDI